MLTQAEIWSALKTSVYSALFTMTGQEHWEWYTQTQAAVQPGAWWEPIIHTHQGRHVRITRADFPDRSSVVATETWHKIESECVGGQEYSYFLYWFTVPIQ